MVGDGETDTKGREETPGAVGMELCGGMGGSGESGEDGSGGGLPGKSRERLARGNTTSGIIHSSRGCSPVLRRYRAHSMLVDE